MWTAECVTAERVQTNTVVNRLLMFADIRMEDPIEVISNKSYTPANGDKRTYVSLATYCWPSNPDDLENPVGPWECKDGLPFPGVCSPPLALHACMRSEARSIAVTAAYRVGTDRPIMHEQRGSVILESKACTDVMHVMVHVDLHRYRSCHGVPAMLVGSLPLHVMRPCTRPVPVVAPVLTMQAALAMLTALTVPR